jgi:hypothetical protein
MVGGVSECNEDGYEPNVPDLTAGWQNRLQAAIYHFLGKFLSLDLYERKPRRDFLAKPRVQHGRRRVISPHN